MSRLRFVKRECDDIFPTMLGSGSHMNLLGKVLAVPFVIMTYVIIFTFTLLFINVPDDA